MGVWTHLAGPRFAVLLLYLHLHNIAGMLNDLRNVRLVSSSDLAGDSLQQVDEASIHPVFPENTDSITEGCKIRLNHTEGSVDGPEDEEDYK
jgi:hypothetical protein